MLPDFPEVKKAITATLEYYKLDRIKEHFFKLENRPRTTINGRDILDYYFEHVFACHENMEYEIIQTIQTTNRGTQDLLFKMLEKFLSTKEFTEPDTVAITLLIDEYNDKTYFEFEKQVNEDVVKFRQSSHFEKAHGEEYEEEIESMRYYFDATKTRYSPYFQKKINSKFYCIEYRTELIDTQYFPEYVKMLKLIIDNFRRIAVLYLRFYQEFNLPATFQQPTTTNIEKKKIKVNISVSHLAYIFSMLKNQDVFKVQSAAELCRFISESFVTEETEETEISIQSLKNYFTKPEASSAEFWVKSLSKIIIEARKKVAESKPNKKRK